MRAAVHPAFGLYTMADDAAPAGFTARRQSFDGALERVEFMGFALNGYLERFVVVVPARFTFSHGVFGF